MISVVFMRHDRDEAISIISEFASLRATRILSGIGVLAIAIPADILPSTQLDSRLIVFYRNEAGNFLFGGYFLRRIVWETSGGLDMVTIYGLCYNSLTERRIIAYPAGSSQAQKSGPADNLMRAVARENLGGSAGGQRDISVYGFSVENDLSMAAPVSVSFAYKKMRDALDQIAFTAWGKNGERVWWDIVPRGSGWSMEFIARKDYTERDRRLSSASPLWISPDMGVVRRVVVDDDRSREVTVVIAGGQGEGDLRARVEVVDSFRIADSVMNRIEDFYDGAHIADLAILESAASARLREGKPILRAEIELIEGPGFLFGRDFHVGTAITIQALRRQFDAVVREIHISASPDREEIRADLEIL